MGPITLMLLFSAALISDSSSNRCLQRRGNGRGAATERRRVDLGNLHGVAEGPSILKRRGACGRFDYCYTPYRSLTLVT